MGRGDGARSQAPGVQVLRPRQVLSPSGRLSFADGELCWGRGLGCPPCQVARGPQTPQEAVRVSHHPTVIAGAAVTDGGHGHRPPVF